MNLLTNIANNKELREALKTYMLEYMKIQAGTQAMSGQDVSGYKEASRVVTGALDKLVIDFGEKKQKEKINHAV